MEDLFYGNLDKSGLKVAKEILPSSYFLVDEFTQINYEPPSIASLSILGLYSPNITSSSISTYK